jgi:3-hydroxyacyl-CoA dehydrogenase/enoyl-CoA hydratase/3-hydroxybutyryl-CoA epimerase
MKNFKIETGEDGVALVTFDVPDRGMNTLTEEVMAELPGLIEQLRRDNQVKGVVLRSGRANGFCAGADLGDLGRLLGTPIPARPLPDPFRRLETLGKPVAVALEGLALGGGFEFALAAHYRVAGDSPRISFGLPEVTLGLLPGGGGTQRIPRLAGIARALPLLVDGKPIDATRALELGLIDEIVPQGNAVEAARRWVVERGDPVARWDRKDFRMPGGSPYAPAGMQAFIMASAALHARMYGNYPAPENILKCVFEGAQVPFDAGLRIEQRYFRNTVASPQAKAMTRTLFLSKQALARAGKGPDAATPPKRVAVIGAGMMGAGIAYAQAARGIETLLLDVTDDAAERGKRHCRTLAQAAAAKGRMREAQGAALIERIHATADLRALSGMGFAVEAVFEDLALKHDMIRRIEKLAGPDAVIGSNTSTLPITELARACAHPENFIGIHFFSPVDRMELVEIIRGEATSDRTVARALAYVAALGKTPIVVKDSRGFYTSRCVGKYLNEGLEMLMEGVAPALIDNAGRMAGMPRGPLELLDDVAIDLTVRVQDQTRAALGDAYRARPYEAALEKLVELGRTGRKGKAGFYDYPEGAPKRVWPGLQSLFGATGDAQPEVALVKRRLLYRQSVEAARCFDEGVIDDPRAADVGAVMGWGFAPWTGGPLSFIEMEGLDTFVANCDRLSQDHGDRFAPPPGLRTMAGEQRGYYDPS